MAFEFYKLDGTIVKSLALLQTVYKIVHILCNKLHAENWNAITVQYI